MFTLTRTLVLCKRRLYAKFDGKYRTLCYCDRSTSTYNDLMKSDTMFLATNNPRHSIPLPKSNVSSFTSPSAILKSYHGDSISTPTKYTTIATVTLATVFVFILNYPFHANVYVALFTFVTKFDYCF